MLRLLRSFLFAGLFMLSAPNFAFAEPPFYRDSEIGPIVQADYPEFRAIALDIFQKYPPTDYVYVGIGRSATSIMALLRAVRGSESTINLPLSRMTNVYMKTPAEKARIAASLGAHFKAVLPSPETIKGKKILVIDLAGTGKTIVESTEQIRAYFASSDISVTGYALSPHRVVIEGNQAVELMKARGIDYWTLSRALGDRLFDLSYHSFAESPRFPADEAAGQVYTRPEARNGNRFSLLVEEFRTRAVQDLRLRKFMNERPPLSLTGLCANLLF